MLWPRLPGAGLLLVVLGNNLFASFGKGRVGLAGIKNENHITAVGRNPVLYRDFFKFRQQAMCAEKLNKPNGVFLRAYNGVERHNCKNFNSPEPAGSVGFIPEPATKIGIIS